MNLRIHSHDGVPIYLQIVRQVQYLVASGRLAPGEQLPPVRRLAEGLVINPNTVARAYRELETLGLLVTRRGAGVFVSEAGSPLAAREKNRIVNERIDLLLAEAHQLGIEPEEIARRLRERGGKMKGE